MEKSERNDQIANLDSVSHRRVQKSINFWSHLVKDKEYEITNKINKTIENIINLCGNERLLSMKILVDLLSNKNTDKSLGNYAHMVLSSAKSFKFDEQLNSFGGMLANISNTRGSGGGCCSELYWNDYNMGYFDSFPPAEDEFEENEYDFSNDEF